MPLFKGLSAGWTVLAAPVLVWQEANKVPGGRGQWIRLHTQDQDRQMFKHWLLAGFQRKILMREGMDEGEREEEGGRERERERERLILGKSVQLGHSDYYSLYTKISLVS